MCRSLKINNPRSSSGGSRSNFQTRANASEEVQLLCAGGRTWKVRAGWCCCVGDPGGRAYVLVGRILVSARRCAVVHSSPITTTVTLCEVPVLGFLCT
ncbi:hypothetical protein NDU88_002141 [Pleurodeles waltl]|uniref:Uncharacterized protein n=1 Tax=Pleurodeles waltl TaxID=8319 RepID=A0AAV7SBM6_PLEWA|nr:hypothetical protein NDU88_002141 [Pleurodeles waltl]